MKQNELDVIGVELGAVTAQLLNGTITLTEFVDAVARFKPQTDVPDCTAGLVCPFTGLRYPTVAETDAFMAEFN